MRVEFLHESGCAIQPADAPAGRVQIEHQDNKTILIIPPDPTCEQTRWLVDPDKGPEVEVTILVERLWWALGEEDNAPREWKDKLLTLSRDHFIATSKKALWLRLPRQRWVGQIFVGFEHLKARRYEVKVTDKTVGIPLRDFGDSPEVGDRKGEYPLKVWIAPNESRVNEGATGIIRAEQPKRRGPTRDFFEIPLPRLATLLTRLRRIASGPLRVLIKEIYHDRPRPRAKHSLDLVEFRKQALCLVAVVLEELEMKGLQFHRLKKRYVEKAHVAKDNHPETMSEIRSRYERLSTESVHRTGKARNDLRWTG